jgi:calcineurin-like phosphoesterase family protein
MCHFPLHTWNGMYHGAWMLHGHCHGGLKERSGKWGWLTGRYAIRRMDVGVDPNNFAPVSFEQVKNHMALKKCRPVDHHTMEDM